MTDLFKNENACFGLDECIDGGDPVILASRLNNGIVLLCIALCKRTKKKRTRFWWNRVSEGTKEEQNKTSSKKSRGARNSARVRS